MAHPYDPRRAEVGRLPGERRELVALVPPIMRDIKFSDLPLLPRPQYQSLIDAARAEGAAAEREKIRLDLLNGIEWLEPADFVPPRRSSAEGDLWHRAHAVALAKYAATLEKP